jgi:uncharacterized membrane protein YgcG
MKAARAQESWSWPPERRARLDPRLLVAVAVLAAVFGVFFAIGRAGSRTSPSRTELPALPAVVSGGAPIPVGLATAPPLDTGVAGLPRPRPAAAAPQSAAAPAQAPAAAPAPVRLVQQAPAKPTPPPAPTPAPAPAPARPVASGGGGSGGSSGSAAHGGQSGSGGGSFDSSG